MSTAHFSMAAPPERYAERRARLAAVLRRPVVLFAGRAAAPSSVANPFPFRAESNYLYFGGPPVEGAALLIEPGSDGRAGVTLARVPEGPDDALWIGEPPGDDALMAAGGFTALCADDELAGHCSGRAVGGVVPRCVATLAWARDLGVDAADDGEQDAIITLRLIKDEHECAALRRAADVTVAAHRAAMAATRPGVGEADVAAAFHAVLVAQQCRPSFQPIVTIHGETLHAHGHRHRLVAGRLLLCDGGAEEPSGYASDVTRTYPVGGQWNPRQRQLHDTVHRAMVAGVEACRAGVRYRTVHDGAARVLCEGLVEAGLLRGDPETLVERRAHTLFFPHGVGHLLGLDVHDMEDFGDRAGYAPGRSRRPGFGDRFLRLDRDLESGMAVTIEPGIYLVPAVWRDRQLVDPLRDAVDHDAVEALLAESFGGIRLEQSLIVRPQGSPEVLTAELPCSADEIDATEAAPRGSTLES